MPPLRIRSAAVSVTAKLLGARKEKIGLLCALFAFALAAVMVSASDNMRALMPGPLSSAHRSITACQSCHTASGGTQLSWLRGLQSQGEHADSNACLVCHKITGTAFSAHGSTQQELHTKTTRSMQLAADLDAPRAAKVQDVLFPTGKMLGRGLECASCHREHQGKAPLTKVANDQCRSCHVLKFDRFDRDHPKFQHWPYQRRTRIIFDHTGHFAKHYPETAKKNRDKRIPTACSQCHSSREDKRVMSVASFDDTCASCHLDQITGKERVTGPKGVPFITLPGLDIQTLKRKNAIIGEWPEASEASLSPFMQVLISRTERGRALLQKVGGLNLQDLASANGDQVQAVVNLVWEIKSVLHALIGGKAQEVLGDLNTGTGGNLSASLIAGLTANLPRDVLVSAQRDWLPSLDAEMANRKVTGDRSHDVWAAIGPEPTTGAAGSTKKDEKSSEAAEPPDAPPRPFDQTGDAGADDRSEAGDAKSERKADAVVKRDPPACTLRVLGQCLVSKTSSPAVPAVSEPAASKTLPGAMRAGLGDLAPKSMGSGRSTPSVEPTIRLAAEAGTLDKAGQSDELLHPTDDELREMKALLKENLRSGNSGPSVLPGSGSGTGNPPEISIDASLDAENWAEFGGWYRQDYAISYRPAGHKDRFMYTWLFLTGPQSPRQDTTPSSAVFHALTNKDAPGACTKCHSIDDLAAGGRVVNFAKTTAGSKVGRFTTFRHEPHVSTVDDRGCLTCHTLEKGSEPLNTYEHGDATTFQSNFGAVPKALCQTCHSESKARQDCMTCHTYHVNGVSMPVLETKLPMP